MAKSLTLIVAFDAGFSSRYIAAKSPVAQSWAKRLAASFSGEPGAPVAAPTTKATTAIADARAALAGDRDGLQRLEQGLGALQAEAAPNTSPNTSSSGPATRAAGNPQPGPDATQVAAAAQMAPADRNSMIESMVARLAKRMAENSSDVDGWLRLIKAYSVLGERDKASAAAADARTALAGNNDNLRRIGELTKELGLEGS